VSESGGARIACWIGVRHEMEGRDALTERLLRGPSRADVDGDRNTAEPSGELSVGDVVRVGDHWLAVARFWFTEVDWPTAFSLVPCWPGSDPLSDERIPRRRWHLAWSGPRKVVLHHDGGADVRS
jgi:hypothetical protein